MSQKAPQRNQRNWAFGMRTTATPPNRNCPPEVVAVRRCSQAAITFPPYEQGQHSAEGLHRACLGLPEQIPEPLRR